MAPASVRMAQFWTKPPKRSTCSPRTTTALIVEDHVPRWCSSAQLLEAALREQKRRLAAAVEVPISFMPAISTIRITVLVMLLAIFTFAVTPDPIQLCTRFQFLPEPCPRQARA